MTWLSGNLSFRVIRITLCITSGLAYSVLLYNFRLYLEKDALILSSSHLDSRNSRKSRNASIQKVEPSISNVRTIDLYWKLNDVFEKDALVDIVPTETINRDERNSLERGGPLISFNENLAQLVFGIGNFTQSDPIQMKRIMLIDSFNWWGYNRTQVSESCPDIQQKCHFVEPSLNFNVSSEVEVLDAVVIARDSFHQETISVPDNVTRIYYTMESPVHSLISLTRDNDLLASYWRGSDIVIPYGKWVYHNLSIQNQSQGRNYASGKSKLAAIFTSNCQTKNDRLKLVNQLQKFVRVDIYGNCGRYQCPRSMKSECFEKLKRQYKFYLAFENSNCRDYITEKIYANAYENDIVPVVMGAHPDDYRAVLPLHSYIHVEDFENTEGLANYLKHLDTHDDEYNKYFEWKGTGKFIQPERFCQMCDMLHFGNDVSLKRKQPKVFHWDAANRDLCLPPHRTKWMQEKGAE